MGDTGLDQGFVPDGGDRRREAGQPVAAHDQRVAQAAVLQLGEDVQPELRAFGVLQPDAQHVLDTVHIDADDQVGCLVGDHAAVADLHAQRVDVEDGVDVINGPVLPGSYLIRDHIGDPRYEGRGHLAAVDLFQVGGNVAGGHTAGVQGQDHVVDLGQAPPSLGHDDWLELRFTVPRHLHGDRASHRGQRFGVGAIAGVARTAAGRVARLVAEEVSHLHLQGPLQDRLHHLLQQAALAVNADPGRLRVRQQPVDGCRRQGPRQPSGRLLTRLDGLGVRGVLVHQVTHCASHSRCQPRPGQHPARSPLTQGSEHPPLGRSRRREAGVSPVRPPAPPTRASSPSTRQRIGRTG